MTELVLQNHPVWRDLTEVLESLDSGALVREHLEAGDYKVCGYWDEQDRYYEEIGLPKDLATELVSSSIEVARQERFLKLKFALTMMTDSGAQNMGELLLVYNEHLEFIDENWSLEIESPFLTVVRT
jgi:hypothetical protein